MATVEHEPSTRLSPAVRLHLAGLRGHIRRYVWLEGLAAAVVWLGLSLWGSLALDWCLELPLPVRAVLLAAIIGGLVVVLFRYILRRAFVPMSDSSMATLYERKFPQFNDSLLTTVTLAGRSAHESGYNPAMLGNTRALVEDRLREVHPGKVINPYPLRQKTVLAACLLGSIALLTLVASPILELWAQRNLLLANKFWPRHIRLQPLGFNDGIAKVASGANFELRVQAFQGDASVPLIPDSAEIRYRVDAGSRGRYTMQSIGSGGSIAATGSGGAAQVLREFRHTFPGVLSTIHFDVVGGDARLRDLVLQVVPNPVLNELKLHYEYPSYMERTSAPQTVAGAMPVPVGTRLTVTGTSNKALEAVRIDCPAAEKRAAWSQDISGTELGDARNTFSYTFDPFPSALAPTTTGASIKTASQAAPPRDCLLLFTLHDTDGIKSREPIPLALVAVPDEPPEVKLRRNGIGNAITANARLPVTGKITDDHGLAKAWFDYTVWFEGKDAKKTSATIPLADLPRHPQEFVVPEAAMEAADAKLARGQKMLLTVRASDLCTLGAGANIGSSESWQIDVVSADELRSMLEARELVLRQRFESIVQEMTETRDLLLKKEFWPMDQDAPTVKNKVAGAEPGEKAAVAKTLTAEEMKARRLESTLMALQNCRKNVQETVGVADGIDDIRLQLINNRIDTEELKLRLEGGVAKPLHRIIDNLFPILDQRLESLQEVVADEKQGPDRRNLARQQADEIVVAMRNVLSRMMAMEDFNVAVLERLRKIIKVQEDVTNRTEKRRTQRIKDLLE